MVNWSVQLCVEFLQGHVSQGDTAEYQENNK